MIIVKNSRLEMVNQGISSLGMILIVHDSVDFDRLTIDAIGEQAGEKLLKASLCLFIQEFRDRLSS